METKSLKASLSENLVTIRIDAPLKEAIDKMQKHRIRHLIVEDEAQLAGILSDRDIQRAIRFEVKELFSMRISEKSLDPDLTVRDLMSWPVRTVDVSTPLGTVAKFLLEERISSLVVTEEKEVKGIVTTDDLLRVLVSVLKPEGEDSDHFSTDIELMAYNSPIGPLLQALSNSGI